MRRTSAVLVLALMSAVILTFLPAQAASTDCLLVGSVNLNQPANLLTADKGTGSFSSGTFLRCVGAVAGQGGGATGGFSFCQHNMTGANIACHSTSTNGPGNLDAVYDTVNRTPFKVAAHAKGSATFSGFTGGVSCTLNFDGHALGTIAELTLTKFQCTNGYNSVKAKRAFATAIPVINNVSNCPAGPGNLKLCFKSLAFFGVVDVRG